MQIKSSAPDLRLEILRDYRNIVALQVGIIAAALMSGPMLSMLIDNPQTASMLRDCIFLLLGGVYVIFLWDFLRNLTSRQVVVSLLFVLIMGAYGLTLYALNPFVEWVTDPHFKRVLLFAIHSVLFSVEAIVIFYAINDLFRGRKSMGERLWGSACVYLMIGLCFGSIYDLVSIADPSALGMTVNLGLDSYLLCIRNSMNIIGGRDALDSASPLMQGIATLEAVWANLFVVLLVGRLLGQQDTGPELD